jgi:hypothetical protein
MVTTNPRINITVPPEIVGVLSDKAQRERVSLSRTTLELIQVALERDEDIYYSKLAENIERKNKKWHSHKAAWK